MPHRLILCVYPASSFAGMLVGVTLLVAVCSEYLTGAIDSMSNTMSEAFIGMHASIG